jgi:hypothetical protein
MAGHAARNKSGTAWWSNSAPAYFNLMVLGERFPRWASAVRYFSPAAATNTAQTPKSQLVRRADTISYKFCALFYYFYTENQFKKAILLFLHISLCERALEAKSGGARMDLKKKHQ